MGRLNADGSRSALRRALFPNGFAGEVMLFMLETWRDFSLHHQVRLEERITALFAQAMEDAYVAQERRWFVFPELPVTDPTFGTQTGRNDLRFYHRDIPGQKVFFTIECKRLHVTTKSGFRHLTDKYVEKGLQRFVDGKYSAGLPCGGMLGYVMDNRIAEAFVKVQDEIMTRSGPLEMKGANAMRSPSSVLPKERFSADTFHQSENGQFVVHHLLVGVVR